MSNFMDEISTFVQRAKECAAQKLDTVRTQGQHLAALAKLQLAMHKRHAGAKLQTAKVVAGLQAGMYKRRAAAKLQTVQAAAKERLADYQARAAAKLQLACAVGKLQAAMYKRRLTLMVQSVYQRISGQVQAVLSSMQQRYDSVRSVWSSNQHFTFWLIPADGQTIAKTHVQRKHLKYAFTGVATFLVGVSLTIGVLAHFAFQNEAQKQEIAAYKASKQQQEQKIHELEQMAEKNQQQLAYLSKLEDKVRDEMQKNGTQLPPKSAVAPAQGGPNLGDSSKMGVVMAQEQNIQQEAKAKTADLEKLLNTIATENYRKEVTPSQWPTSGGYISSPFGGRRNPFDGYSRDYHPGIDIAIDYGAPVYASATGYVQQAGWFGGYGLYIKLSHDYGFETAYGHMSSIAVNAGSYVKKGQLIGYVGSTGYSTGPHLHFEVLQYGEQVNPSKYM